MVEGQGPGDQMSVVEGVWIIDQRGVVEVGKCD